MGLQPTKRRAGDIMIAGAAVQAVTTAPQKGSAADFTGRVLKWAIIIILLIVVFAVVWVLWSMYSNYGLNPLDPSTWDDSIILMLETKWSVSDTGQSTGGSLWTVIWRASPFGFLGGAIGIGTSSSGRIGMAENVLKGRNAAYTFFKRLSGN